ncbi:hypothetical protein [Embleya sp. NBC_00896]|uniref:hypothetical protein n=1 Tax=Embleya sp. NBC_00896 TaxID=2975961 RepID=UPI003864B4C5|nr:hypothetical protein OG928_12350 [Embleya sp. NBC_00896]
MISILKTQRQAFAATPVVVSVGSAKLSHAAPSLSKSGLAGLPVDLSYARTDALITAAARLRGNGSGVSAAAGTSGLGLAVGAEGPWQGEQAAATRRNERPSTQAACEQAQETRQANGMTMAGFAGNGYPSWRTRT